MFRILTAGVLLAASTAAFAAPAPKFLNNAARGDSGEVQMGQLLQQRSSNPAVRSYGRMLVADHGAHRSQVDQLARRLGIRVSHSPKADAMAAMRHLRNLHGRAFDQYARSHAIEDHQKDIAEYQAQVRTGDRATARLASATLPTLRKHLQEARALR